MLLTRKSPATSGDKARPASGLLDSVTRGVQSAMTATMNRRTFLKRSGIGLGAGAAASTLTFQSIRPVQAQEKPAGERKIEVKRTVCTHCSVGCALDAVVENGVWLRQEPVFDSPLNMGAHCAMGASVR